jgi:hypothetical protein
VEETRMADESKITEKDLHFYYKREERLAKASARVREFCETRPNKKFALFSSLTDSKPKAALFTVIVIMCLMILFTTYLLPDSKYEIGSNIVAASAMRYNNASFIVLKKEAKKKNAYNGLVTVTISPAETQAGGDSRTKLYNHTVVFGETGTEEFRWSIPLETNELLFFLQAGTGTASFRIKVE